MAEFRTLMREQWRVLLATMVPALEALVARDELPASVADTASPAAATDPADPAEPPIRPRVRLGLYTHSCPLADAAGTPNPTDQAR